MSPQPVADTEVTAALAAMPLSVRGGVAAEYVWLINRAKRMDRIAPDIAAKCRAEAAALLLGPVVQARCAECSADLSEADAPVLYRSAVLGIEWRICQPCQDDALMIAADHATG